MARFTITIPDDLNTELEREAEEKQITKTKLIQDLLMGGDHNEIARLKREIEIRDYEITNLKDRVRWLEGEISKNTDIMMRMLPEGKDNGILTKIQRWINRTG